MHQQQVLQHQQIQHQQMQHKIVGDSSNPTSASAVVLNGSMYQPQPQPQPHPQPTPQQPLPNMHQQQPMPQMNPNGAGEMPNMMLLQHQAAALNDYTKMVMLQNMNGSSTMSPSNLQSPFNTKSAYEAKDISSENVDLKSIHSGPEFELLSNDYDSVVNMNLVDNDNLDNLYSMIDKLAQPNFAFNMFTNLYAEKYSHLFKQYPSLHTYVSTLLFCIAKKNESFILTLGTNSVVPTINCCNARLLDRFKRKRDFTLATSTINTSTAAASAALTSTCNNVVVNNINNTNNNKNNDDTDGPSTSKNIRFDYTQPIHPMMNTEFYKSRSIYFNIGKCTRYINPSEFALINSTITVAKIKKYISHKKTEIYSGIKIDLDKPILSAVNLRQNDTHSNRNFFAMEPIECLMTAISKATNLSFNKDAFTMGKQQTLKCLDLDDESNTDPTKLDSNGFTVAVLHQFNVFQFNNDTLGGRTFANKLLYINNSNIMDDTAWSNIFLTHRDNPQHLKELDDYYIELKKYNNFMESIAKSVANSKKNTTTTTTTTTTNNIEPEHKSETKELDDVTK